MCGLSACLCVCVNVSVMFTFICKVGHADEMKMQKYVGWLIHCVSIV